MASGAGLPKLELLTFEGDWLRWSDAINDRLGFLGLWQGPIESGPGPDTGTVALTGGSAGGLSPIGSPRITPGRDGAEASSAHASAGKERGDAPADTPGGQPARDDAGGDADGVNAADASGGLASLTLGGAGPTAAELRAMSYVLMFVDRQVVVDLQLRKSRTLPALWRRLEQHFRRTNVFALQRAQDQFRRAQQGPDESVRQFVSKVNSLADLLDQLGNPVSHSERKQHLLSHLLRPYRDRAVQIMEWGYDSTKTMEDCIRWLESVDDFLAGDEQQEAANAADALHAVGSAGRADRRRCYGCGQIGHIVANCPEAEESSDESDDSDYSRPGRSRRKGKRHGHKEKWCSYCDTDAHDEKKCVRRLDAIGKKAAEAARRYHGYTDYAEAFTAVAVYDEPWEDFAYDDGLAEVGFQECGSTCWSDRSQHGLQHGSAAEASVTGSTAAAVNTPAAIGAAVYAAARDGDATAAPTVGVAAHTATGQRDAQLDEQQAEQPWPQLASETSEDPMTPTATEDPGQCIEPGSRGAGSGDAQPVGASPASDAGAVRRVTRRRRRRRRRRCQRSGNHNEQGDAPRHVPAQPAHHEQAGGARSGGSAGFLVVGVPVTPRTGTVSKTACSTTSVQHNKAAFKGGKLAGVASDVIHVALLLLMLWCGSWAAWSGDVGVERSQLAEWPGAWHGAQPRSSLIDSSDPAPLTARSATVAAAPEVSVLEGSYDSRFSWTSDRVGADVPAGHPADIDAAQASPAAAALAQQPEQAATVGMQQGGQRTAHHGSSSSSSSVPVEQRSSNPCPCHVGVRRSWQQEAGAAVATAYEPRSMLEVQHEDEGDVTFDANGTWVRMPSSEGAWELCAGGHLVASAAALSDGEAVHSRQPAVHAL
jgi:hypothetical protein